VGDFSQNSWLQVEVGNLRPVWSANAAYPDTLGSSSGGPNGALAVPSVVDVESGVFSGDDDMLLGSAEVSPNEKRRMRVQVTAAGDLQCHPILLPVIKSTIQCSFDRVAMHLPARLEYDTLILNPHFL